MTCHAVGLIPSGPSACLRSEENVMMKNASGNMLSTVLGGNRSTQNMQQPLFQVFNMCNKSVIMSIT
jgi:hypothetical protein